MKLEAQIGGDSHDLEMRRDGKKLFATIDGRKYELESSEPEPDVFLLKNGGKVYQAFVSSVQTPNGPLQVTIENDTLQVTLVDPKRLRSSGTAAEHGSGVAEIRTAMPGKIMRILVSRGEAVQKGDGVIVVEAMKMQNEMRSPKDGVVVDIRVAESSTVSSGDVLVVID